MQPRSWREEQRTAAHLLDVGISALRALSNGSEAHGLLDLVDRVDLAVPVGLFAREGHMSHLFTLAAARYPALVAQALQ